MNGISLECACKKKGGGRERNERPGSNIWTHHLVERHSSEQLHKHKHYCLDGGREGGAAEPEQGVPGITKLIWGQTGDTCALKERRGLRIHAALMRGGRLSLDSACLQAALLLSPLRSHRSLYIIWQILILICLSCRAPPLHCRVNKKRNNWEYKTVCAVYHVLVHLGRCFTTRRVACSLIITV